MQKKYGKLANMLIYKQPYDERLRRTWGHFVALIAF